MHINGKKGDVFSIGGWFKGNFDDNGASEYFGELSEYSSEQPTKSLAQIKVTYTYTEAVETKDEETGEVTTTEEAVEENFAVDFAPHNEDWQYAEDSFALKGDVDSLDVTIIAQNIPAVTYARDIALAVDDGATVTKEDEDGIPDENEEICSCGCEDCTYGENCPCTGAINNDCQCPECLRKETTTQDNFGNTLSNKSTDGIKYIETLSSYTSDGNHLASYTDENGNVTEYAYNIFNGVLEAVTSPMGTGEETTTTSYEYDAMGNVVSVSTADSELQYVYTNDKLTEIITENGKFTLTYDIWGQVTAVNVVTATGVIPLVLYSYNTGKNRTQVKTVTYSNSAENTSIYSYEYYDNGNIKKVKLNNDEKHSISYDNLGNLIQIKNVGGRTVKYTDAGMRIYDNSNALVYTSVTTDDGTAIEENYGVKYKELEPSYDYNADTGVSTNTSGIEIGELYSVEEKASTDWFGREDSHTTTIYDITAETEETPATVLGKIDTDYVYPVADGKTSQTIEKYINKTYNGNNEEVRVFDGYYYEYDKQNRISAEKTLNADGNTTTDKYSYEYDKLGQLVRFNDAVENKTFTYSYDSNGNILAKTEYAYTTGELGTATNTITYSYDTQWADKLISVEDASVGNKTISYDNIGNPTYYLGADLTWEGRNLVKFDNKVDKEITYKYDENGMRYRTIVKNKEDSSEITIDYVWVDSKLISTVFTEDGKSKTAKYLYNDFDEPVGMFLTDEDGIRRTYYYLKNAQGDITNIVDSSGRKMVEFTYDAWGKRSVEFQADLSNPNNLPFWYKCMNAYALTPFGYRGYCFDTYTGLYYLQSRYYDPNTGRFINADDTNYLNATGTVLSCNLFAYCENDAVNRVDPRGNSPIQWVCAVIGGVAGWFFGDYIARRCGFTPSSKSGKIAAKYWAIRIAVTAGGAAIGYLVGTAIVKLVTRFLIKNPRYVIKIINRIGIKNATKIKSFLGINLLKYLRPGTLVNILKKLSSPGNVISTSLVKLLFEACNYLNIGIIIHTGHEGTNWTSYHMHVGSARVHIAILEAAYYWLKAKGVGNG